MKHVTLPTNLFESASRRAHLVNLTCKAFASYNEAVSLLNARQTDIHPSRACIEEAALLAAHRLRRYRLLEARLATETGLATFSVFNNVSMAGNRSTRLMSSNL